MREPRQPFQPVYWEAQPRIMRRGLDPVFTMLSQGDSCGRVTEADLIDFIPTLREEALKILYQYDVGPLYTPPSFRGAFSVPGSQGEQVGPERHSIPRPPRCTCPPSPDPR